MCKIQIQKKRLSYVSKLTFKVECQFLVGMVGKITVGNEGSKAFKNFFLLITNGSKLGNSVKVVVV